MATCQRPALGDEAMLIVWRTQASAGVQPYSIAIGGWRFWMRMLIYFAGIFIDTFGITHPSEEGRQQAARYIALLLLLLFVMLCSVVALTVFAFHL